MSAFSEGANFDMSCVLCLLLSDMEEERENYANPGSAGQRIEKGFRGIIFFWHAGYDAVDRGRAWS